ncbi:CsgG/HfaB family protein [Larkinella sp. GY13]|uniref:CsgG/HfaB family protein n=1 Tax=Larkinella sp. GY13 TaxID=3453720 RepID=UPI003EE8378C
MKVLFTLAAWLFVVPLTMAQVSSQPVVSVFPFKGNYSDRVTSAVFSGLTSSRRVKTVDSSTLDEIVQQQKKSLDDKYDQTNAIQAGQLAGAQFMINGEVTAVNFSNQRIGNVTYNNCNVEAKVQVTDLETGVSEFETLQSSSSSSSNSDRDYLVNIAMSSLMSKAESFARRKFPASMQILEVLEKSEKKGIISFRVEGEGLTSKASASDGDELPFPFPLPGMRTRIIITNQREVARPDGTKRIVNEEVAFAKIKKVEDGGTALCTVTEGGKRLQELWDKQARLMLKTTN